jgi:hypothetical protein
MCVHFHVLREKGNEIHFAFEGMLIVASATITAFSSKF